MLQCCITYELNFVSMVLQNTLKEKLLNVSKVEGDVNKVTYYSIFEESGVFSEEPLEKLSCALALVTDDNQPVAEAIFKLLDQRSILMAAEETEDFCLLEKLRLVYVMSAYHPSLTFSQRHHLLTVYLHQLDEMYDYKLAEIETKEVSHYYYIGMLLDSNKIEPVGINVLSRLFEDYHILSSVVPILV